MFAVATAGLFPIIHLGRPWFGYWILRTRTSARSGSTSAPRWSGTPSPSPPTWWSARLFLVSGMIPDAAALRDASRGWRRRLYAVVALGWRGTDEEWRHHSRAYLF